MSGLFHFWRLIVYWLPGMPSEGSDSQDTLTKIQMLSAAQRLVGGREVASEGPGCHHSLVPVSSILAPQ